MISQLSPMLSATEDKTSDGVMIAAQGLLRQFYEDTPGFRQLYRANHEMISPITGTVLDQILINFATIGPDFSPSLSGGERSVQWI